MKFKVAFAKKTSGNTDRLMVYYSINCGSSWMLKLPLTTGNLTTAPDQTSPFVPGSSDWVEKTMNFTAIGSTTNIRFKFQFESGGGNNIYLDDINIGMGSVGQEEIANNISSFNVFPNPTKSSAQISFHLNNDVHNLSITIKNTLGQITSYVIKGQAFNSGKYTLKIDEERKLSPGMYLIEFNADNNIKTQKLIIQ